MSKASYFAQLYENKLDVRFLDDDEFINELGEIAVVSGDFFKMLVCNLTTPQLNKVFNRILEIGDFDQQYSMCLSLCYEIDRLESGYIEKIDKELDGSLKSELMATMLDSGYKFSDSDKEIAKLYIDVDDT